MGAKPRVIITVGDLSPSLMDFHGGKDEASFGYDFIELGPAGPRFSRRAADDHWGDELHLPQKVQHGSEGEVAMLPS